MKVNLKRQTNILSFPEEYSYLEQITKSGHYRYLVSYRINPSKAFRTGGSLVNIHVTKGPFTNKVVDIFSSQENVVERLLNNNAVNRDLTRNKSKSNIVLTIKSDFTAMIPNGVASSLTMRDQDTIFEVRETKLETLANLRAKNINPTINDINLSTGVDTAMVDPNIQVRSYELIANSKLDPSTAATKNRLFVPSLSARNGVVVRTNGSMTMDQKMLIDSLSSYIQDTSLISENMDSDDIVPVEVISNNDYILVEEYIDLPVGLINYPDFYLTFELVDGNGTPLQTESRIVNHSKNLLGLQTPKLPPSVNVQSHIGRSILSVKQEDKNATSVNIYRKVIANSTQNYDANYSYVGNLKCTYQDGTKRYEDSISNINSVIYRIIPVDNDGILGSEFTNIVSKAGKSTLAMSASTAFKTVNNFSVLSYNVEPDGITVEVRDIPPGVISVVLNRTDMSVFGKQPVMIEAPQQIVSKGNNVVYFKDTKLSVGKTYKYSAKLIYKGGSTVSVGNTLLLDFKPEQTNIVNTSIVNTKVVTTETGNDIQFVMKTEFILTNEDDIQKALGTQGLSQFFLDSIRKDKVQDLVAYGVTRINLTTGDVEDFGIVTDEQFSDAKFGVVKGVAPVQVGNEYKYTVNTYLRSAETLLQDFVKTVSNSNVYNGLVNVQTGSNYTYVPSRWQHPVVLTQGNLISEQSLKTNHAQSQFTFGKIGKITSTTLSLTLPTPTLFDISATKVNSKLVKIQWKLQGNASKVDHFIVTIDILGKRTIAGKCHNITNSNQFQFYDVLDDGEKGALTYYVVPVYYDYSRGKEIGTNKVYV